MVIKFCPKGWFVTHLVSHMNEIMQPLVACNTVTSRISNTEAWAGLGDFDPKVGHRVRFCRHYRPTPHYTKSKPGIGHDASPRVNTGVTEKCDPHLFLMKMDWICIPKKALDMATQMIEDRYEFEKIVKLKYRWFHAHLAYTTRKNLSEDTIMSLRNQESPKEGLMEEFMEPENPDEVSVEVSNERNAMKIEALICK